MSPTEKSPKISKIFYCECCDYNTSSRKDLNKHLSTRKHKMIINGNTNDNEKIPKIYICDCGKKYNFASGLSRHKTKCNFQQENTPKEENPPKEDERDKLINILFNDKKEMIQERKEMLEDRKEMKELIILLVKSMQDNQSNQIEQTTNLIKDVIPHVGGTTNTTNTAGDHNNLTNSQNTLNFYLTNTCKDAESITDFTNRFCERIETFFNGNYDKIAHNQISLADNVQTIFFECMDDKTQPNRFIQTTDKKNGIFYVKEQKKDEENKLVGDAEFVKYNDGFDKHGAKLGHAIHKTLHPCKNACIPKLEQTIQAKPNEDDYEDYEEYEQAYDNYRKSTGEIKENLMFQTHYAMNLFDNKQVREKTLSHTKRSKSDISNR